MIPDALRPDREELTIGGIEGVDGHRPSQQLTTTGCTARCWPAHIRGHGRGRASGHRRWWPGAGKTRPGRRVGTQHGASSSPGCSAVVVSARALADSRGGPFHGRPDLVDKQSDHRPVLAPAVRGGTLLKPTRGDDPDASAE